MGPTAVHAAALERDIRWLALEGAPVSYGSMAMEKLYVFPTSCMVAGALTAYDLPDLLGCVAPRKIALVRPVDEKAAPLPEADLVDLLQYPISVYASQNRRHRLKFTFSGTEGQIPDIVDWCSR